MFYSWDNPVYSDFMVKLLDHLEPRLFEPGSSIAQQQQEIIEKTFIMKGTIKIGHNARQRNKATKKIEGVIKYTHSLKAGGTVGAEMMFDLKSYFTYTASRQPVECFAIRKTNWRRIQLHKMGDVEAQIIYNQILFKYKQRQLLDFLRLVYLPPKQIQKCLAQKTSFCEIVPCLKSGKTWRVTVDDTMLYTLIQKVLNSTTFQEAGDEGTELPLQSIVFMLN